MLYGQAVGAASRLEARALVYGCWHSFWISGSQVAAACSAGHFDMVDQILMDLVQDALAPKTRISPLLFSRSVANLELCWHRMRAARAAFRLSFLSTGLLGWY